ncbi:hypothetical protein L7F22_034116 [Adiantum nelumboides]|nr:hypothetical protein [Adiantum nelumboides]
MENALDKLDDLEYELEKAYEWLDDHKGDKRKSCSSRKKVCMLQKACERLRDAYEDEFEEESSDEDDDGWVCMESLVHQVGIPKMEEKETKKEAGQKSLEEPLDNLILPLECAHGVEEEYPLLKITPILSNERMEIGIWREDLKIQESQKGTPHNLILTPTTIDAIDVSCLYEEDFSKEHAILFHKAHEMLIYPLISYGVLLEAILCDGMCISIHTMNYWKHDGACLPIHATTLYLNHARIMMSNFAQRLDGKIWFYLIDYHDGITQWPFLLLYLGGNCLWYFFLKVSLKDDDGFLWMAQCIVKMDVFEACYVKANYFLEVEAYDRHGDVCNMMLKIMEDVPTLKMVSTLCSWSSHMLISLWFHKFILYDLRWIIDVAVAKNQKLLIAQELPQLLKKICEQKDNEMFQPAIMVLLLSVKNAICFGWFSHTEGQELLRLSKELGDFFTGVGGWSQVDKSRAFEFISKLLPRFYPLMTLQTVIVALEAKPGYEAMVCDFYVPKKPIPSNELRMFVIRTDNQEASSCLVTPNHVNFLVNGKGVEKRSLTSMDVGPQMPSNVTSMLKIGTNLLQIVGDFPGNYLIAIALTTSRTNFISPLELQIFNHDGMKAQTDEELVEGPSRVSLLCPISHKRITSPVKGVSCKHHQCFDYNTFMEINSRRPSWRCPYCNRNVSFPDLRLDLQMLKILKESDDTAVDVMVLEDGSWKMLSNEITQISSNPKRDGSSPNMSGDTSAEEGEFRLEKNNSNYIELSDTEDQDRQNQESARHSFAGVSLGGSGGGQLLEDRKPDVREINLAMATASAGQTETAGDGATTSGEQLTAVAQSSNNMLQPLANEGHNISEGIVDRQVNREISRSPIAIQALPAQTGTTNASLRVRPRTSSQPNSPAHPNSGVYSVTPSGQLAANQRPLQVQLPSFVGIQDGQVLLNMGQPQQVQIEVPELLTNTPSLQSGELRDYRQRAGPHAHQQRTVTTQTFSTQPVAQASPRASRDHPYHPGSRSLNPVRVDRQIGQQQTSVQQLVRPDSPSLPDPNQFWQQVRLVQPTQQQLQGHLSIGSNISREEFVSPGLPSIAEGIPMFNQSVGGSGAVANTFRRQTSQTTRTVPGQYLQSINNPLIVSNNNASARDQRWSSLDGISGLVDASNTQLSEQVQRAATRMRGSVTLPVTRDTSMVASVPPANTLWMHGSSSQPSRFSPGVSLSGWNSDAVRHSDPSRSTTATGMNLQSIQTASTLVSDFDNWFDTHNDSYLAYQGLGDLGDMRPG